MKTICIAMLLFAASIGHAAPVTLIGRDLSPRQVNLQSVRNDVVTYFDMDRAYHNEPLSRFLQFRFTPDAASLDDDMMALELTDGQRYTGRWIAEADGGDALRWRHPQLGEIVVRLETVRAIRPANEVQNGDVPTADRVMLSNGDLMRGFVVSATAEGLAIQLEGRRDAVTLPRERIVNVTLANPAPSTQDQTHMIYLADSSRVRAAGLTVEGDRLRLTGAPAESIALASVGRIDVAARGARLIELSDLPMTTLSGGEVFGMPMPPRVDAGVWRMHAPLTLGFDLPPGATRFAAVAQIDAEGNEPVQWTDFVVRIVAGDAEHSCRITREQPTCRINLPFGDAATILTIELDAGVNGPVMDRLRLRDAVVLIEQSQ
jgi:hypothetical protein